MIDAENGGRDTFVFKHSGGKNPSQKTFGHEWAEMIV
jgi:hypothetical protein